LSGYRLASLSDQQLADVVATPAIPRERRIGAALALAGSDRPDIAAQLRVAADCCADPNLEAAIEDAAASVLDERRLARALTQS
jgi:hypothetical protein